MYDLPTFLDEAKRFFDISQRLHANWTLSEYVDGDEDSSYLYHREEKRLIGVTDYDACNIETGADEGRNEASGGAEPTWDPRLTGDECVLDISSQLSNSSMGLQEMLTFEYHVFFSQSYSVPTLYFKVYRNNGKALRLEEFWNIVPKVIAEPHSTVQPRSNVDG